MEKSRRGSEIAYKKLQVTLYQRWIFTSSVLLTLESFGPLGFTRVKYSSVFLVFRRLLTLAFRGLSLAANV